MQKSILHVSGLLPERNDVKALWLFVCFWLLAISSAFAQGNGCAALAPEFINYEPCKFRVSIKNTSECTPSITVLLESGSFDSWSANTGSGWSGQQLSPTEILLTHISGIVPLGQSFPLIFTLPYGLSTTGNFTWDFTCGIGEGCTLFPGFTLESCPDPQNASISGVKYLECNGGAFANQPTLPGWPIQLLAEDGVTVISETETDANGAYAFYDLPFGVYIVKEAVKPGWSPNIPASGQSAIQLAASQQVKQNFGNCPACSCDSIYYELVQLPVTGVPCNYALNLSSNSPAGCFTQANISMTGGTFSSLIAATGWNAVLLDSQHVRLTYAGGFIPSGVSQPLFFTASGAEQSYQISSTISGQVCTQSFGPFPCPPPVSPPPCCPQGNTWGPELVINPDFQGGYNNFTNGYTAVAAGSPMTAGNASVANQAQTYASNNQWSCLDHTTFSAAGLFLVVDGYANPVVWQQPVTLTAGTTYSFYAWFNNLVKPQYNYADPMMGLFVGSTQVGAITLSESPDQWQRLCGSFTAQQSGAATISIRMIAGSSLGNDIAIDDISFRACVPPQPCQVSINVVPINNCGLVQVVATSNGQLPIAYQWCDGQTVNGYVTQLPCGPHTFCVTVTCPDGSTATASVTYVVSDPIPPTCVTVPGFGVTLNQNCAYNLTPQQIDGGSTDNCQIQSMSVSPTVLTGCGNTTVTLTVTDWCGNTSTCVTGVQTIETVPPVITNCPTAPVSVPTNPGVCFYQGPLPALTATDNCGTVTTFNCFLLLNGAFVPITSSTQFPKGNNTIRCTAVDNCGNVSQSCTYTLLVEDKENPTITCPLNVNVIGSINPVGLCSATVNNIAAVASDNCPMFGTSWVLSGATTGSGANDASGQTFNQGTTTVTYTVTDMANNTATCSFTVNVACSQWSCNCPQGNVQGPELVINGTFQAGNTGFTSGYAALPPTCSPQEYTVTDPVQVTTLCNNWAATDHTTGNATAGWLFFAADGSQTLGIDAWRQSVTLTAGQTYKMCAWVKNLNFNLDRPDPVVEAYVLDGSFNPIGGPIATTGPLPEPPLPSGWVQIMGSFTATTSGTHYLAFRTSGTSFEGNNFALDDISFKSCTPPTPSCTCAAPNPFTNLSYKPNSGPNVPINCGQFAVWQCQLPTFNLSGNFACQGNGCVNPIPMNWVLTHPILGVVNQGSMTGPGFLVSIPSSSFPNPGVYNLLLSGICGTDTCYCEIKIETPGCGNDCTCAMPNAFTNMSYKPNSGPNVPINCGQIAVWQCQFPTFNLGGNFACQGNGCANPIPMNWVLTHPILGVVDQGSMTGPNFSVSIPNSSFPNPGVYNLLLSGICGTDTCYCEIKIETPGCGNGCTCGEVTWAQIFKTWDWNSPIKCNNAANPVVVPCLKNGQNYFIHGDFTCSSSNCATGAVTWVLDRPNPLTNVSGTATGPYPHFDILLSGSYFTQPGVYQLTVSRTCGTNTCSCTFYFEVRSCPCDCASLPPVTQQGFNMAGSIFNCKRTFTPAAQLCSNDQVFWFVNFSLAGTTTGSTPFMYNFATGGSYWVCMLVARTDPNTGQVCYYARCRYIKVKCLTIGDPHECVDDVVKNGLFNEGVTPGELDGEGSINNWEWFPNTGNGAVFADSTAGANDDGALVFSGGLDNFGAVYQQVDLAPEGFITLDFFYRNMLGEDLPAGTVLELRLHSEPVPGSPNQVLHTEPISSDTSAGGWQNKFVSKQYAVNPDYKYLIVCLRNQDSERQSLVALDNLVICSSSAQLTETDEAEKALQIRLFPNPNTGEFTVELSETATAKHRLRIVNLTGQVLYDAPAQEGQSQQNIRTRDLPAGLYFLQVLHEGRLMATKKFVRSE